VFVLTNLIMAGIFFMLYWLSDEQNIKQVAIFGIFQYIWMFVSWFKATKNIMNIYLIFLALSFFFYLGQPILYLFNIEVTNVMSINTSPFTITQVNTTLKFLLRAMALFHVGASFTIEGVQVRNPVKVNKKAMVAIGKLLFLISAIPAINFLINSLITTFTVGYANIFESDFVQGAGVDGGIPRLVAGFFDSSLLLLILGNIANPKRRTFWIGFSIVYSLLMVISGQRGSNVLFLISIVLLYHFSIKPFTKRQLLKFVWIGLSGIVLLSLISSTRNMALSNIGFEQILTVMSNNNLAVNLLGEMGFTLIACTTVMVFSPSAIPFNGGATYINSLLTLIPNLFWDVHPAAQGGVDQVFKSFLFQNSGIGSSFIIEAYYNFGYWGLLIIPMFGFIFGKMYFSIIKASRDENYLKLFMWLSIAPNLLWFVRSETITFWRNFGYYTVIPLIMVALYTALARKMNPSRINSVNNMQNIERYN